MNFIIEITEIETLKFFNEKTQEIFEFQIKDFNKMIRRKAFKEFFKHENLKHVIKKLRLFLKGRYKKMEINLKEYGFKQIHCNIFIHTIYPYKVIVNRMYNIVERYSPKFKKVLDSKFYTYDNNEFKEWLENL